MTLYSWMLQNLNNTLYDDDEWMMPNIQCEDNDAQTLTYTVTKYTMMTIMFSFLHTHTH